MQYGASLQRLNVEWRGAGETVACGGLWRLRLRELGRVDIAGETRCDAVRMLLFSELTVSVKEVQAES